MTGATILAVALVIDAAIGWPRPVHAVIGHPVTWLGRLITSLDEWLNFDGTTDRDRRTAGLVAALLVILAAVGVGLVVTWLLPDGWVGMVVGGVLAWPLLAARSLHDHVVAVARPLAAGDLAQARVAVAEIVGRDPETLDKAGVARAALESLSENASDGVIAPLFWGVLFGLPGIAAYKAINTLDSMLGHRTPRHEAFGWASARIDDAANFVPARLTALLFSALASQPRVALACTAADARSHRSPNAGWPEAALAGALGVRLSGPRAYEGEIAEDPWINGECPDPIAADIKRGLKLYRKAMLATLVILVALALI